MKRFIGILLVLLLVVVLIGCQKATTPTIDTSIETSPDLDDILTGERIEEYDHIIVDIADNGGYYCLMSKATIEYHDEKIANIFLDEPAVLAFQVPKEYAADGVGVVDGTAVLDLISQIHTYLETNDVDEETKGLLCNIMQWFDDITLLTSAST